MVDLSMGGIETGGLTLKCRIPIFSGDREQFGQ